jgi:aryl-phospho-beta-D-glucosidase BglC (GH1 family)
MVTHIAWLTRFTHSYSMLNSTSTAKTLKVFHAHRTSFITEYDLRHLSNMGIRHVRVPLSWCFTDHDPDTEITDLDEKDPNTTASLLEKFTCPDPFYPDVVWPAIPKVLLTRFLRSCTKFGITASLDLHTYPGATSPGTFSGGSVDSGFSNDIYHRHILILPLCVLFRIVASATTVLVL